MTNPSVIFTANRAYALSNSRTRIMERFLENGYDVIIATKEDSICQQLCEKGMKHELVEFNRGGLSPIADFKAFLSLKNIVRKWKPVLMHNFHAKPVMMGTIASKNALGDNIVVANTITGLGHAFVKGGFQSKIAGAGYKMAMPKSDCTIFQNRDDMQLFLEHKWVSPDKSKLIIGSGVELSEFTRTSPKDNNSSDINIVMAGRLLNQKGIGEFVEIATRITAKYPHAKFLLAGEYDPIHPDSIELDWIQNQSAIQYVGQLPDMRSFYESADILLFPSYREGVPRVILEAASMEIPTIAFEVPGVTEAVINNETGILVNFNDVDMMTSCVQSLIEDSDLRSQLGSGARRFIQNKFDIKCITEMYLETYREFGIQV